ncbi:MAG: hypothetical protein OXC92_08485 [Flavobacteriaceae bacterium]|nr:hypothetical protein [Flavobacteriaceae bacterium]
MNSDVNDIGVVCMVNKTLSSVIEHWGEKTPHIHAVAVPLNDQG